MTSIDNFFDNATFDKANNADTISDTISKNNEQNIANTDNQNNQTQAKNNDVSAFAELGLSHILLKSIAKTGYTNPTPIQAQAIPSAIAGRDLLLSAQTGSGKTAAFVLPILQHLSEQPSQPKAGKTEQKSAKHKRHQPKMVKALILTPTRELAHQVSDSIRKYGSSMRDLFSVPLVGGSPYNGQIRALKKGVQIIIATPGRLLDHINAGRVDLSELSILVLDEADRMLDMGFADDIEAILQATPEHRQTIMSSATWDGEVGKIAETFTQNPERISIKVETAHIDEKVYFCDNFDHKNKLLEHLICDQDRQQAIIFTATKRSTEELAERLEDWGHKVCYLHGDLPQGKRNRIVADLRNGRYQLVVATDVAARGIDLPNISHVFNYDLPRQVEDYVHRIGRSGRAGRTGVAINLCSRDDRRQFANINRYLKRDMVEATVEGLEPKFVERNERPNRSRGRNGGNGGGRDRFKSGGQRFDNRSDNRFENRGHRSDSRFDRSEHFDKKPRFKDDKPKFERGERFEQHGEKRFDDKPRFAKNERFDRNDRFERKEHFGERGERHFDKADKGFDRREKSDKKFGKRFDEDNRHFDKKPRKFGSDDGFNRSSSFERDNRSHDKFDKKPRKDTKKDAKSDFPPRKKGVKEELYGATAPKRRFR